MFYSLSYGYYVGYSYWDPIDQIKRLIELGADVHYKVRYDVLYSISKYFYPYITK